MEWLNWLVDQLGSWMHTPEVSTQMLQWLGNGMQGLALLVGTYFLAKMVSRWMSGTVCRRVDETLGKFVGRIGYYSILISGFLAILAVFKIPVAGAMAALTAAGFAVGLAFQGTLSNFASGVLLLVFRPFKVGDLVLIGGALGRINEIDIFTTTLDTPDNRRMVVPNSAVTSGTIENVTYHPHRRVDVTVGVPHTADVVATREALTEAAERLPEMMIPGEKRGFQVLLGQLSSNHAEWTVRFWGASENFFVVRDRLTQEVKLALDRAGIGVALPQMQLHWPSQAVAQATESDVEENSRQTAPHSAEEPAPSPVRPRMRQLGGEAA